MRVNFFQPWANCPKIYTLCVSYKQHVVFFFILKPDNLAFISRVIPMTCNIITQIFKNSMLLFAIIPDMLLSFFLTSCHGFLYDLTVCFLLFYFPGIAKHFRLF